MLLCCDNIKDCSVAAVNVLAKFAELSENRWEKFEKFSEYQIKLITATRKNFGKPFHRFSNTFEGANCLVKIFCKKTSSPQIFHSLHQRAKQKISKIWYCKFKYLAFFWEFFQGGGIYCYTNFYCYSIVFWPNFREGQKFSRGTPLPPPPPPLTTWYTINMSIDVEREWILFVRCFIKHNVAISFCHNIPPAHPRGFGTENLPPLWGFCTLNFAQVGGGVLLG